MSLPSFIPNFKILGQVVPEKSLTEKKVYKHTEKAKTIYPLYTLYTGGIIIKWCLCLLYKHGPHVNMLFTYARTKAQLCSNCASDQHLYFSHIASTIPLLPKSVFFNPLTIFLDHTARFVSDLVENPKDRFCCNQAHMHMIDTYMLHNKSLFMRKLGFCICESKDADQLRVSREADQRLCFHYIDSTIPLLPKYKISSL